MAALSFFLSSSSPPRLIPFTPSSSAPFSFPLFKLRVASTSKDPRNRILASRDSPSDDFCPKAKSSSADSFKKSVLSSLIQEIEPLDVSLIQKDVPLTTVDAMKRTISGMLGLLPSNQFQVSIEALWDPLSKLLVSSMMTGYTLRNAEYRLFLERNFDTCEENPKKRTSAVSKFCLGEIFHESAALSNSPEENEFPSEFDTATEPSETADIQGVGEICPEVQQYILHLQSRLSSVKKELREVKRRSAALQMQKFVGEEKNDLLDYLRSLQPEKVAELSEPTSPELKEAILSVVHGLLATLSPKMHSKAPLPGNASAGAVNVGSESCAELVENTSLQFQPLIALTRDYLARLLFWCMLLGHYLRGLEYRTELTDLLSVTRLAGNDDRGGKPVA